MVDANYAKVIRAVRSSGVLGKRLVTADVVYINGLEEDRTEVDSVVLKEPVDQVVPLVLRNQSRCSAVPLAAPLPAVPAALSGRWTGDSCYLQWDQRLLGHTGMDIGANRGYCHSGSPRPAR